MATLKCANLSLHARNKGFITFLLTSNQDLHHLSPLTSQLIQQFSSVIGLDSFYRYDDPSLRSSFANQLAIVDDYCFAEYTPSISSFFKHVFVFTDDLCDPFLPNSNITQVSFSGSFSTEQYSLSSCLVCIYASYFHQL